MKNFYKQVSQSLMILGIVLFTATSCGGDEKKEIPNESLQGLWRLTEEKHIETDKSDSTILFPDTKGVQPYIRFNASTFNLFQVSPTDTTIQKAGAYTKVNNELTLQPSNESAINYGYEITGNRLVLIEKNSDVEISKFAVKVVGDPFLSEDKDDAPDNIDEEAITGCARYHDADATPGTSLNPLLIETDKIIKGTLKAVEARNGFEAKYYLQVEPNQPFRINILNINTGTSEVISFFEYTTISITDAFSTEQFIFNKKMEKEEKKLIHDAFTSSKCLYIEFFSYQEEVDFEFKIENLSETKE